MADNNLTVDVSINTKSAIKDLNSLQSEVKVVEKEFNNASKAQDGYEDSLSSLNSQLTSSSNKIKMYQKQIAQTETVVEGLNQEHKEAVAKLKQLETELGVNSAEYKKQEKVVLSVEKQLNKYNKELGIAESNMNTAEREAKALTKQIDKLGDEADGSTGQISEMSSTLKRLDLATVAMGLQAIGANMKQFGTSIVNSFKSGLESAKEFSSELETQQFLLEKLPESVQTAIKDFGAISLDFGFTNKQGQQVATDISSFFQRSGILDDVDLSSVWERIFDLSAMYDLDTSDVAERIQKMMLGNFENSDALGFNMNVASLEEFLNVDWKNLSYAEKQLKSLDYIMMQTEPTMGRAKQEAEQFTAQYNMMGQNVEEIKGTFFTLIGEALTPLISKFNEMSEGIKNWIADNKELATMIGIIVAVIGGLALVLGSLALVIAPIMLAMPALKGIATAIKGVVMGFNPWILAIMAVVGGIVLLYNKCEWFRNAVNVVWEYIKEVFISTWNTIVEFFKADTTQEWLITTWTTVRDFLVGCWTFIKDQAMLVWGVLTEWWNTNGQAVITIFTVIWDFIKGLLLTFWNNIKKDAENVWSALTNFWTQWGDEITAIFTFLWDSLVLYVTNAFEQMKDLIQTALDIVGDIIRIFADILTGDWEQLWIDLQDLLDTFCNFVQRTVERIVGFFTGIGDKIKSAFGAVWGYVTGERSFTTPDVESRSVENREIGVRTIYDSIIDESGISAMSRSISNLATPYYFADSLASQQFNQQFNQINTNRSNSNNMITLLQDQNKTLIEQTKLLMQLLQQPRQEINVDNMNVGNSTTEDNANLQMLKFFSAL